MSKICNVCKKPIYEENYHNRVSLAYEPIIPGNMSLITQITDPIICCDVCLLKIKKMLKGE